MTDERTLLLSRCFPDYTEEVYHLGEELEERTLDEDFFSDLYPEDIEDVQFQTILASDFEKADAVLAVAKVLREVRLIEQE